MCTKCVIIMNENEANKILVGAAIKGKSSLFLPPNQNDDYNGG